jgi:FAD/FMN-containing dehydrogenase
MRKHGLTIDNLLGADVVTADGELLRASDVKTTYDPDNVFHHNQNIRPRLRGGVGRSDGARDV